MMPKFQHHNITTAESRVEEAKRKYLEAYGWKYTCDTPGSLWLWTRAFTFAETGHDYSVMTVPTDLAIHMTQAVLDTDEEEEFDG